MYDLMAKTTPSTEKKTPFLHQNQPVVIASYHAPIIHHDNASFGTRQHTSRQIPVADTANMFTNIFPN